MLLIIPDGILFLSGRLDDNCLNNLLTSRTEPLKVIDGASHHGWLQHVEKCLVSFPMWPVKYNVHVDDKKIRANKTTYIFKK